MYRNFFFSIPFLAAAVFPLEGQVDSNKPNLPLNPDTSSSAQINAPAHIKVIVFDFGSVIAKTDKQMLVDFLSRSLQISSEEAEQAMRMRKIATDSGADENVFWQTYAKERAIPLPADWFEKFDNEKALALQEVPGMIPLVLELQRLGFQTALLSNVRETGAAIRRKLGLYNLFSPVLLSCEIQAKKPDAEAFAILINELKVSPDALLFIDNKEQNVKAAQAMGIDSIVFTGANDLIEALKKRGIVVSIGYFQAVSGKS